MQGALTAAARLTSRDDVGAVLLPHREALTTDVMYVGETVQRPALTWFRTNAAQAGAPHALAPGVDPIDGRAVLTLTAVR